MVMMVINPTLSYGGHGHRDDREQQGSHGDGEQNAGQTLASSKWTNRCPNTSDKYLGEWKHWRSFCILK